MRIACQAPACVLSALTGWALISAPLPALPGWFVHATVHGLNAVPAAISDTAEAGQPEPAPPSAEVAWGRVAESYRRGLVGERVRIGVVTPRRAGRPVNDDPDVAAIEEILRAGGPEADEQRGVLFLRVTDVPAAARSAGADGSPVGDEAAGLDVPMPRRILRVEMGDLRVYAEPGRLLAARQSVPGGVVLRAFDGPVTTARLMEVMPPIALPQLAMALGEEPGEGLMPGMPPVSWESSRRVRDAGRVRLVLGGSAGEWRAEAVIDEATDRLVRFSLTRDGQVNGVGSSGVEWFVSPIDPGEPESWRLETAGRIAVESIDALRSAPPAPAADLAARIKTGDELPRLYLYNARTEAWSSEASVAGRFAGVVPEEADRFRVALLVYLPATHAGNPEARSMLRRWRQALERGTAQAVVAARDLDPATTVASAGIAMIELDRFDESRRSAARDWSSDAGVLDRVMPADLLCSPAGRAMFSRFSESGSPVILVVDQSLAILAMIRGDDAPGAGAGAGVGAGVGDQGSAAASPADASRVLSDRIRAAIIDGL